MSSSTTRKSNQPISYSNYNTKELFEKLAKFKQLKTRRLARKPKTRNAAVSIIIRFCDKKGNVLDISKLIGYLKNTNIDAFKVSEILNEETRMELFYIKRSINPLDRWSGHVAFPGGRQEEGETTRETAERETLEEVGLNLKSSEYHYLGCLDDRYTMPLNLRPFLIATHVFLQVKASSTRPCLDKSEVAACRWVDLESFTKPTFDPLSWPAHLITSRSGPKRCKIGTLEFPAVQLMKGEEVCAEGVSVPEGGFEYRLWGLTLDISEEFLTHLGVMQRGQISYLPKSTNPLVGLYVLIHFYLPHQLKASLLYLIPIIFIAILALLFYIIM